MGQEQKKDASGSAPQGGLGDIQVRVEAADKAARQITAAKRTGRRLRVVFVIGVLLVLFFFGLAFYSMAANLGRGVMKPSPEIQNIIGGMVRDDVAPEFQRAAESLLPTVRDVLTKKAKELMPKLMQEIRPQFELLVNNARREVEETLKSRLQSLAKKQESKLRDHFPELRDEKKVDAIVANMQFAVGSAASEVLVHRLEKGYDAIESVYRRMIQFLPDDQKELERRLKERWSDVWSSFYERQKKAVGAPSEKE